MAQSKFTLYKYVKTGDGSWRYKKATFYSNGKIKPNVVVAGKNAQGKPIEELHAEGSYKMNHNGTWLDAGGMPGSTRRSFSVCAERHRRRARLCNRPLIGSRCQRLPRSISRTARSGDWTPRRSASTAVRLILSSSTAA